VDIACRFRRLQRPVVGVAEERPCWFQSACEDNPEGEEFFFLGRLQL